MDHKHPALPRTYHLSESERGILAVLLGLKIYKQCQIAAIMSRDPGTISREIKRGGGKVRYDPGCAQELFAQARMRACANARRISEPTWAYAKEKLEEGWSPEQISGRLELDGQESVSHETLYLRILADQRAGGTLYRYLRRQKARRKRYGSHKRRGSSIPNRVSIDKRPAIVDTRKRRGDWEADLVIGAGQQQALVRVIERKSRYSLMAHVPHKTADNVSQALTGLLIPFKDCVHTLTTDNGTEFAWHELIAKELDADFYFAHPYSSWERGSIENNNGLARQYFPKTMYFNTITQEDIDFATHRLNHRPRKCLGFKTPDEVFFRKPLHSLNNRVAVRT